MCYDFYDGITLLSSIKLDYDKKQKAGIQLVENAEELISH